MKGQRVGCIRGSSYDQNLERQLENKVFSEKASGKGVERPQLQELIQFVREGWH